MLTVESPQLPLESSVVEQEIDLLSSSYQKLVEDVKNKMIEQVSFRLRAWHPDPEVLSLYPFFANIHQVISDYKECLDVVVEGEYISLVVDTDLLAMKGLPVNLSNLLEYGNQFIPPFPHIRTTLQTLRAPISSVVESVKKEVT